MELVLLGDEPLSSQTARITLMSGTTSLVLDARRLGFVRPLDLAGLVAVAHSPAVADVPISLIMPEDLDVACYLAQAGVLDALPSRTSVLGRAARDDNLFPPDRLMAVRLLTADTVERVADDFGELVSTHYPRGSGLAVSAACNELLANAEEHGACVPGAFVAAQVYTGETTDSPRLDLAVCDNGIGVLAHLRQNPRWSFLTRDDQALDHARRAAVSGISDERGNGLADLVATTSKHGDLELRLRSGFGELSVNSLGAGPVIKVQVRDEQTQGTWAWLTHRVVPARQAVLQSRQ